MTAAHPWSAAPTLAAQLDVAGTIRTAVMSRCTPKIRRDADSMLTLSGLHDETQRCRPAERSTRRYQGQREAWTRARVACSARKQGSGTCRTVGFIPRDGIEPSLPDSAVVPRESRRVPTHTSRNRALASIVDAPQPRSTPSVTPVQPRVPAVESSRSASSGHQASAEAAARRCTTKECRYRACAAYEGSRLGAWRWALEGGRRFGTISCPSGKSSNARVIEFGDETGSPRSPKGRESLCPHVGLEDRGGTLQCPLQSRYFLQEALTNLP